MIAHSTFLRPMVPIPCQRSTVSASHHHHQPCPWRPARTVPVASRRCNHRCTACEQRHVTSRSAAHHRRLSSSSLPLLGPENSTSVLRYDPPTTPWSGCSFMYVTWGAAWRGPPTVHFNRILRILIWDMEQLSRNVDHFCHQAGSSGARLRLSSSYRS